MTAVHNLQDDEDLALNGLRERELAEACRKSGMKFVPMQIQDGSADAMAERLDDTLGALTGSSAVVNGSTCTAMPVSIARRRWQSHICARMAKMSLDEACAHVKARRTCGPFMTILEDYFGPRHHKPGQ